LIRFRTRSSSGVCSIWSKHAWMSASSTHSWKWLPKKWISAIASCARRFGRNPYEHDTKSASKMGSSTALRLA
jgi:hypothetical protein